MSDVVFRRESAVEYFKDLVEDALAHQRVSAGELTSFYVVQLLASFVHRSAGDREPLALKLAQAFETAGVQQRVSLKEIGDVSLFVSGFFSDSFRRRLVDVDYYTAIGGHAYAELSRCEMGALAPVFGELAEHFGRFVDVLNEVSERTHCASNADLMRLYEKWVRTGSPRSGQLLAERGVAPNASIRTKSRIQ